VQEYVSLSFSPDGKLLLAQGSAPDWSLLLWSWEKSKVASSVRSTNLQGSPVVQVSRVERMDAAYSGCKFIIVIIHFQLHGQLSSTCSLHAFWLVGSACLTTLARMMARSLSAQLSMADLVAMPCCRQA